MTLVSIPLNDTSVPNASSLASRIGPLVREIVVWDATGQRYKSYIPGVPLNNFPIRGGKGYFGKMAGSANATFQGMP